MKEGKYEHTALLLLRLALAFIFLWHGIPKLMDTAGTMGFFSSLGLPGFVGVLVGIVEVLGGILLIVGSIFPIVPYALAIVMLGALGLVQVPGLLAKGVGAGFERDILILLSLLVLASHGAGLWAWKRR